VITGPRICHVPVPLLFDFEEESAQVLNLSANIPQDAIPELLPFHGQFYLLLDISQSLLDIRPALQYAIHLNDDNLQAVGPNLTDIAS
jgi:hypothetical protein